VERVDGVPGADLVEWARGHEAEIDESLRTGGAILFRGFAVDSIERFQAVRDHFLPSTTPYVERATPRRDLGNDVFSSTEFPASEAIALHNENSYAMSWPGRLLFCCLVAPATGGSTPLADVRAVLGRLSEATVEAFRRSGWMLVRHYGSGFGLPWETAFGTTERADVEAYCRAADVELEWLEDGGLQTRQVRPALARHPVTGETLWFNHIRFWHASMLPDEVRELLVEEFGEQGLPYNTYFGDGEPIPDAVVDEIADAYDAETLATPWEPGDVLLVDNMLVAHGREPFSGERRVVVSMGETRERSACLA
jgi:alpha-ketoglutarate-dependent taurine dioxygenase